MSRSLLYRELSSRSHPLEPFGSAAKKAPKKRSRVIRARIRGQQLANNSLWKPKKTN
jgi:hypothetical protein